MTTISVKLPAIKARPNSPTHISYRSNRYCNDNISTRLTFLISVAIFSINEWIQLFAGITLWHTRWILSRSCHMAPICLSVATIYLLQAGTSMFTRSIEFLILLCSMRKPMSWPTSNELLHNSSSSSIDRGRVILRASIEQTPGCNILFPAVSRSTTSVVLSRPASLRRLSCVTPYA